jgi:hypothetical protein
MSVLSSLSATAAAATAATKVIDLSAGSEPSKKQKMAVVAARCQQ